MRVAKNRKKLVDKIIENGKNFRFYDDKDMSQKLTGRFEDQEKAKKIVKDELYRNNFAYLYCTEGGHCDVHVTMKEFFPFEIDPKIIEPELKREREKEQMRKIRSEQRKRGNR
jgi:hypothetical protein